MGEKARDFLGAAAGAGVVVVGDVANHAERMLVQREEPGFLHRHGAAGDRMGVDDAGDLRAGLMDRARDRKAAAIDRVLGGLDIVTVGVELDQRGGGDLLVQETIGVDQEMLVRPRDARGDPGVDQVRPAKPVDEPIARRQFDPGLPFGLGHALLWHWGHRHWPFSVKRGGMRVSR